MKNEKENLHRIMELPFKYRYCVTYSEIKLV